MPTIDHPLQGLFGKMREAYDNVCDAVGKWKMAQVHQVPYLHQPAVYVNVAQVVTFDANGDAPEEEAPPAVPAHVSTTVIGQSGKTWLLTRKQVSRAREG